MITRPTDDSLVVACMLVAVAAQLDRQQLVEDMRRAAAAMASECPDLAEGLKVVSRMADAIEEVTGVSDLLGRLKSLGAA